MDNTSFIYVAIGLAVVVYLTYNKTSKRNKAIIRMPDRPFPSEWKRILEGNIEFYKKLSSKKKKEFEEKLHVFLLNVRIIGINTEVNDVDRILVGSSAIIPIFGFPNWHYANVNEVQIYPDIFDIPESNKKAKGLVGYGAMEGKVYLSKKAIHEGFADQNDQLNVAIHEFIHVLDKQDGKIDGILGNVMQDIDITPWLHVIQKTMNEIDFGKSSIRDYGAVNQGEFLAVVSEYFFESPEKLKSENPSLYNALDNIYNPKVTRRNVFSYSKNRDYKKQKNNNYRR